MSRVDDIRSAFVNYFAAKGHEIVPSGSLVPQNDPTLMFTNSGMVQFKDVFTGLETRPYIRAASVQRCVRAGGKHNDLESVGRTARHHTFFEMLGNFSFGDYFKDVAIELAWNLITREFGISPAQLFVTVYADDDEAFSLWRRISGLPESRIIRIASSDNFWTMGDTGPCGPCSEIFFDHGSHIPGGAPGSPDQDGDRFVEIWNLVFMQFEQRDPAKRVPLEHASIDTGMGLERISAVLQGVHDNYEIDLFRSLIAESVELTGIPARGEHALSHRILADHLRASCFLISDGVMPSNEGRGYVLRRIMRRAMRHAHLLGTDELLMYRLVPILEREMGHAYPELSRAVPLITEVLRTEEERFRRTIDNGLSILEQESDLLRPGDFLSGAVAFRLYDTYGFPLDLTEDVLKERGISVDKAGFDSAMQRQREMARGAWVGSGESALEDIWFTLCEKVGSTHFLGYEMEHAQGHIVAILRDMQQVDCLEAGEEGLIACDQTPFYPESGGQVGDHGTITADGVEALVNDTQKKAGNLIFHQVRLVRGQLKIGQIVQLSVNHRRRDATKRHHSAVHLLQQALRDVLGSHVVQKGSLVESDRLRFDFSHRRGLTPLEITQVQEIINRVILRNEEVTTRLMSLDEAMAEGAMALFGEKYGDKVRVVSIGHREEEEDRAYSLELCGGTHVRYTGDIVSVIILSEGAVSAGVRRIEAIAGATAQSHILEQCRCVQSIASILKTTPGEIESRCETLLGDRKKLQRDLADVQRRLALAEVDSASSDSDPGHSGSVKMVMRVLTIPAKELRFIAEEAKKRIGSGIVAFVSIGEGEKVGIIVGVTEDLAEKFNAVELVRVGASVLGGQSGGGSRTLAQSGGVHTEKAESALKSIHAAVEFSYSR